MVSLLILTGCQTVPTSEPIEIPSFSVPAPSRPTLEVIPSETSEAIKVLTINLSLLDGYVKLLEMYAASQQEYYDKIIAIITQT